MAAEFQTWQPEVGGDRSRLKTGFLAAQVAKLADFLHQEDFLPLAFRSLSAGRERLVRGWSRSWMLIASRWAKRLGSSERQHFPSWPLWKKGREDLGLGKEQLEIWIRTKARDGEVTEWGSVEAQEAGTAEHRVWVWGCVSGREDPEDPALPTGGRQRRERDMRFPGMRWACWVDCPHEQWHGPGVTAALEQKTHCESGKLRGGGRDGGGART